MRTIPGVDGKYPHQTVIQHNFIVSLLDTNQIFRRRATTIRFFSQHLHLSDHLESTALQGNETAFWYFLVQSLLPLYPRTFALEIWRVPGYKGAPFADQPEFHERLTIVT
jgi:hypothetical protein